MRLENFIALRFIIESRKNKNISSASAIVVSVIAVGIIFFICALSIMNGYIYGIMKISFEIKSFHLNYQSEKDFNKVQKELNLIKKDKRVLFADIYRETKALINAKGKNTGISCLRSFNENIFSLDKGLDRSIRIVSGNKTINRNEIMISLKTSEKLRVKTGDYVFLIALDEYNEDQSINIGSKSKIVFKRLKISGIFSTGFVELDEQLAYIGNNTADNIFLNKLTYNIMIKLKDYSKANQFSSDYQPRGFFGITTWEENNYSELTALKFEKNIIAFIVILVIFVAVLNVLSTIYITVAEKNQDIGMLKAMGLSPFRIVSIFVLNGIYLGLLGILFGVILGLLIMNYLNEIILIIQNITNGFNFFIYKIISLFVKVDFPENLEIFSKDFYLDKIYTDISFIEIILISCVTFIFCLISSIIPAIRAGNIKPNEVIRNG